MEIHHGRLRQRQHGPADGLGRVQQLPTGESLGAEALVHVIVERAHLGIGEAIHRIGEHAHYLHQGVARHSERQCFGQQTQRGNIGLGAGPDVFPLENFGQFPHHRVVETELPGDVGEIRGGVTWRFQLLENAEQIALAGGRRRQVLVIKTPGTRELDQPQSVQRVRFEFPIRLPVQQ